MLFAVSLNSLMAHRKLETDREMQIEAEIFQNLLCTYLAEHRACQTLIQETDYL